MYNPSAPLEGREGGTERAGVSIVSVGAEENETERKKKVLGWIVD